MEFANRLPNVVTPTLHQLFGLPGLVLPFDATEVCGRRCEAWSGCMAGRETGVAPHARIVATGRQRAR